MARQQQHSLLPVFALALVALLPSPGLFHTPACAQQESQSADKPPNATAREPEFGPRGQRAAREIKYDEWQKFCFKPGGAKMTCRTTVSGTWETGQTAVRADLIEREGEDTSRLQLFLPVGLYLQAGVNVTVDQGKPYRIPYSWCLTNTCIAADVADRKLIQEMESGKKLTLEVLDTNLLKITTSIPLDQFATVRAGAPKRTFEQAIDE